MLMHDTAGAEYEVTLTRDAIERRFEDLTRAEKMSGCRYFEPGPPRGYTACGRNVRIDVGAKKLFVVIGNDERELLV